MNIPFFCVFLAFLLNYLSKLPLAFAMAKATGGYNNHEPREQQAALTGWGKRALAAHLNSFEIFPAFAAAVIMAHVSGMNESTLTLLCLTFIASRIVYIILYLMNFSTLRSSVWMAGTLCVAVIFLKSAM